MKHAERTKQPAPIALAQPVEGWNSLRLRFKDWRRRCKAAMPYVRRREYRILEQRVDEAMEAIASELPAASSAAMRVVHSRQPSSKEVCLFVTHAPDAHLKSHVIHHMQHLRSAGIDVVLIVNTDQDLHAFELPPEVTACQAVLLRENRGFDFAAWAQAALEIDLPAQTRRVYFVNDSIFGPVSPDAFHQLIERIRSSSAEMVGLTEALAPIRHLQSYFFVFQGKALEPAFLGPWLRSIRLLPTKSLVIAAYETRLTRTLEARGFRCEAIFPTNPTNRLCSNDTSYRWQGLLASGFPYIKVSVLSQERSGAPVQRLIPTPLLQTWDLEQSSRLAP